MGELDAAVHEFTNLKDHGADASTAPSGKIWAMDRLQADKPRLTALVAPLPEGVTKMHTHGLALKAGVLYAANHAFAGGGERVERWRVTRAAITTTACRSCRRTWSHHRQRRGPGERCASVDVQRETTAPSRHYTGRPQKRRHLPHSVPRGRHTSRAAAVERRRHRRRRWPRSYEARRRLGVRPI